MQGITKSILIPLRVARFLFSNLPRITRSNPINLVLFFSNTSCMHRGRHLKRQHPAKTMRLARVTFLFRPNNIIIHLMKIVVVSLQANLINWKGTKGKFLHLNTILAWESITGELSPFEERFKRYIYIPFARV